MLMEASFPFSLSAANQQPCYRGGPATLVCKAVIDETHDSKTFVFEDSQSRSFDFKPGQYISFKFEIEGKLCPPRLFHLFNAHPSSQRPDYRQARAWRAGV
ncbi:hypothetical protein ACVMB2_005494 [Sinorhizobium meliloti]